jgi:hypothetical protein
MKYGDKLIWDQHKTSPTYILHNADIRIQRIPGHSRCHREDNGEIDEKRQSHPGQCASWN